MLYTMTKWDLFQICEVVSTLGNQLHQQTNEKSIILIGASKTLTKSNAH